MSEVSQTLVSAPTSDGDKVPRVRLVILVGALLGLLSGLDAALLRLGLEAPVDNLSLASAHGVLMLYGFIGTAITLERAVAMQANKPRFAWAAYAAPLLSAFAVILVLLQASPYALAGGRLLPGAAWSLSFLLLTITYVIIWYRQPAIAVLIQLLGAVGGMGGIMLWTRGFEVATVFPWWMSFLVLTIVGERLELARISFMKPGVEPRVLAESCALMVSLIVTVFNPQIGYPLLGVSLAILMADVAIHDVARHTVRTEGLTRFMAACMISGYGWAMVTASIWIVRGPVFYGFAYDTVVHSMTIGFALSMILAHAPVIIPAVARKDLPYHPVMWAVWLLLETGLAIRVLAGARQSALGWQFGGSVGVVSVLAFVVTTVTLILLRAKKS